MKDPPRSSSVVVQEYGKLSFVRIGRTSVQACRGMEQIYRWRMKYEMSNEASLHLQSTRAYNGKEVTGGSKLNNWKVVAWGLEEQADNITERFLQCAVLFFAQESASIGGLILKQCHIFPFIQPSGNCTLLRLINHGKQVFDCRGEGKNTWPIAWSRR